MPCISLSVTAGIYHRRRRDLNRVLLSVQSPLKHQVEILDWETKKQLCFLDKVEPNATIREIRLMFHKLYPRWYPARQSIKLDPSILIEYTGPLFIYFLFYFRMTFVYGLDERFTSSPHPVVNFGMYLPFFPLHPKVIETVFVHRFSRGTMPLRKIVKNCFYYWGFAAWLAYYINHPLYTPPSYGKKQINFAVIMFLLCEAGNFSIHVALSDLRRNGSKARKIPYPTKNPFTWLFFFVSCPNYTYEDKVILINRDINANAVTRNILNFLGQNRWGPGSVSQS
ncbi:very-long-chain enoyl-CoA reductase isoform X2 [Chiroxiphia lanceolata]|uniref:very-long-chain enoyl-CoA reductase isoform X2 n=1 Tax=Chiroxiphia lanceolata TaxID=296741 RepID=UPI0013CE727D|nr:very-long-chain enoyl-CoA reductase isoform X2 [Chiroxiphia lanceolata]